MAIGTLAAIGIGLAGAGAVASSSAQKSAANKAAQASNYASDQAAAVTRENYDKSAQALAPWQQSGLAANNQINALLGLNVPQGGSPGSVNWANYVRGNPDALANWNAIQGTSDAQPFGGDMAKFGQYHYGADGSRRDLTAYTAGQAGGNAADTARNAFDQFRNSTGYQFQMNEAMRGVNSGYAGIGALKSGAALRAAQTRANDLAGQSFYNYLGALGNQQSLGANAASAQAGVAQNAGNSLAQIAMNKGDNAANAALAGGGSGFGNALSLIGGGLFKLGA